jgi:hypothetical protein
MTIHLCDDGTGGEAMSVNLADLSECELVRCVEALQEVQKRNRTDSASWLTASLKLAPLFAELAERQRRGEDCG